MKDYLEEIEQHIERLPQIQDDKAAKKLDAQNSWDDEAERSGAFQESRHYAEDLFPVIMRNSFVVMLWSNYEFIVIEIAEHLDKRSGKTNGYHFRGRSGDTLSESKQYLKDEYDLDICLTTEYNILAELLFIRNIIAHNNGRISHLASNRRKSARLNQMLRRQNGLSMSRFEKEIVMSKEYVAVRGVCLFIRRRIDGPREGSRRQPGCGCQTALIACR